MGRVPRDAKAAQTLAPHAVPAHDPVDTLPYI
jgi:hypothetical protein